MALAALLLLQLETNAWLLPPVLSLGVGGSLVAVGGYAMSRWRWRQYWLITAAALLLQLPLYLLVQQWQNRISQRRAGVIIRALATYHRTQQQFPDSLAQLTPRYLPRLPTTAYGIVTPAPFQYYSPALTNDSATYQLGYGMGLFVQAFYSSSTGQWTYHE
ncbi:hypothetical protein [Hymenobacter metallilatus]|uniref:Uncharacterized protein n=1 Tax=Hymenobacter metallilatus TaxID=2493666 RepID=A0A428JKI2_9BACT|nr:hypothetical protein [Hymenobacter metallilatus]RSK33290.1 hypothetical protein EI290_11320 [Hymenobacter metallilatus]